MKTSYFFHLRMILSLALFCSSGISAQQWPLVIGGSGSESGSIAIDGMGNTIIAGRFETAVDFGGGAVQSPGSDALFLAKYDADGNHLWSLALGGNTSQCRLGSIRIAADRNGNIFLTRCFSGTINLGGEDLTAGSNEDLFVAKFDATGRHLWSFRQGGTAAEIPERMAIDAAGDIYLTGFFAGSANLGGASFLSKDTDIFIVKYNAEGDHVWSRGLGDSSDEHPTAIEFDNAGSVLITGFFGEGQNQPAVTDLGGGQIVAEGEGDVFVAKYGAGNGDHIFSHRLGSSAQARVQGFTIAAEQTLDLAVDQNSGAYFVTGLFREFTDLGGDTLTSTGKADIFIAKYDVDGNHLWSAGLGGTEDDAGFKLATDDGGDLIISGTFQGAIELGNQSFESAGGNDIFISRFSAGGSHLWTNVIGGDGNDVIVDLLNTADGFLIQGSFDRAIRIGEQILTGRGQRDIFMVKLDLAGRIITRVNESKSQPPVTFKTEIFPNPFAESATINLAVAQRQRVEVGIYDLTGRKVAQLYDGVLKANENLQLSFISRNLPNGQYFVRTNGRFFTKVDKIILLK